MNVPIIGHYSKAIQKRKSSSDLHVGSLLKKQSPGDTRHEQDESNDQDDGTVVFTFGRLNSRRCRGHAGQRKKVKTCNEEQARFHNRLGLVCLDLNTVFEMTGEPDPCEVCVK